MDTNTIKVTKVLIICFSLCKDAKLMEVLEWLCGGGTVFLKVITHVIIFKISYIEPKSVGLG